MWLTATEIVGITVNSSAGSNAIREYVWPPASGSRPSSMVRYMDSFL